MSCVRCQKCRDIVDSDYDPDCFIELPKLPDERWAQTIELCETCRENYVDEDGVYYPKGVPDAN